MHHTTTALTATLLRQAMSCHGAVFAENGRVTLNENVVVWKHVFGTPAFDLKMASIWNFKQIKWPVAWENETDLTGWSFAFSCSDSLLGSAWQAVMTMSHSHVPICSSRGTVKPHGPEGSSTGGQKSDETHGIRIQKVRAEGRNLNRLLQKMFWQPIEVPNWHRSWISMVFLSNRCCTTKSLKPLLVIHMFRLGWRLRSFYDMIWWQNSPFFDRKTIYKNGTFFQVHQWTSI